MTGRVSHPDELKARLQLITRIRDACTDLNQEVEWRVLLVFSTYQLSGSVEVGEIVNSLEKLRGDHRNMMRLLDLLREQLGIYSSGGISDFDLMSDIMGYTLHYPDTCHHPLEDRLLTLASARDPALAPKLTELRAEHGKLGELCRKMAAAIRSVALDAELPREWFEKLANEYIAANYDHMKKEETEYFPLAEQALTLDDWKVLDQIGETENDPLFGKHLKQHYQSLHARIIRNVV